MKPIMRTFEIHCGVHRGIVQARNAFSAWRKVVGTAVDGFAPFARVRQLNPRTPWEYAVPRYFDMAGK
jgi:hypothetical protein